MMKILQKVLQKVFLVMIIVLGSCGANAQILGWDANNNGGGFGASPWTPVVKNVNVTTSGLVRGSNIGQSGTPAGGCWGGANGWSAGSGATTDNSSFHFTVVANAGYKISLSNITTATRRSNSGPSGYTLYYSVNGGAFAVAGTATTSATTGTTGTPNSITLSSIPALQDVPAGSVIKFRINPSGSAGNYYITGGTNCLRVNGTVTLSTPDAPVATAGTNVLGTGFTANWNAVTGATGYKLDVATDAAFTQIHEIYDNFTVAGNTTSQFVSLGILPNTTYYYRVRAEINAETSPNSNTISLQTPNPLPAAVTTTEILPASITTSAAVSGGNVTDTGNDNVSARGIAWGTTANPTTASATTNGTGGGTFTSNLAGLSPNTQYFYRAYATNSTGTTYGTEYSFYTHANTPGAPTVPNTDIFGLDLALDINGNPAGTLFAIKVGADMYVTANGSTSNVPVWQTAAQWGASIDVNGLTPNTAYTFSVAAQNGAGVQTPFSATVQGTTDALAGPTTLTLVSNSIDFEPACLSTDPNGAVGSFVIKGTNLSGSGIGIGDVSITGPAGAELEGLSFSGTADGSFDEGGYMIEDMLEGEEHAVYVRFDPTAGVSYGTMTFVVTFVDPFNSTATPLSIETIIVDLPQADDTQSVCDNTTVAGLQTTSGTNIKWYTAATGGTALAATDVLTAQTYYASQSVGDCESGRIPVAVTIIPNPVAPVAPAQDFCGPATIDDLEITTGEATKWYNVATGGTALAATEAITTGNYYVTQTVNGCESPRTTVAVTVNPIPALPTVTALTFCGPTSVGQLTVTTGTAPKWYAAETGGEELEDTAAVATGTYYVTQTVNGCESPRTAVTVTVNPIPAAPTVDNIQTFCEPSTLADLDAADNVLWYSAPTGGTALAETTAIAEGTSIYYAAQTAIDCESTSRTAVAVQLTITPAPVASAQTFCGTATVSQLMAGTNPKWYAAATGGTAIEGTTALATGTYYASQTVNGCESTARTAVAVTVNAIPAAPAADAQDFCGSGVVGQLAVTTGANAQWYAAETGGSALATNTALATGTYYVSQTVNGCESTRTAVAVTVSTIPAPPATNPLTLCGPATAAELLPSGEGIQWYLAATGGTAMEETADLATGIYYVSQTVNGCESVRTAVSVTVNTTIAPTADAHVFCGIATVGDLEVTTGTDVKWYPTAAATEMLEETAELSTGTYYVSQTLNECEGPRTAVEVTVNLTPAPQAEAQSFCSGTVADLEVTSGEAVKWYSVETEGEQLEVTTELASGTYYVSQTLNECEGPRTAVEVTIVETVIPTGEATQEFEEGSDATLADLEVEGENIVWYAEEELTTILPETTELVDGTIYYAVATQGECMSEALAVTAEEVLGTEGFNLTDLKYYPNPVNDMLTLSYGEAISSVVVYNLLGQPVLTKEPNTAEVQLDMTTLAAGSYILKVVSGNASATIKVIKR